MGKQVPIEEVLASASPLTKTVEVCVNGDLRAERDRLEDQLASAMERDVGRLTGNPDARRIAEEIQAVEERMQDHMHDFTFRALHPKVWSDLRAAHPPEDPRIEMWNAATFPSALVSKACISHDLSDATLFDQFMEKIGVAGLEDLFGAAIAVNNASPKGRTSSLASDVLRNFEKNSQSAPATESPAANS